MVKIPFDGLGATPHLYLEKSKFDKLGQEIKNGIVDATVELLPY
jgi:hypothetical protein